MELEKTPLQEWIKRRVAEVEKHASVHDILTSHGIDIPEVNTDFQVACPLPGHGPDNRPSARYYGSGSKPHFYCFKCRIRCDAVNLHAKLRGIRFMDALVDFERKFHIKISRRPEGQEIIAPSERGSDYASDKWRDIPRVLAILERKLLSVRDKCSMLDYIKFCRLMDAVQYDYDKTKIATPEMISISVKAISMIDEIIALPDNFGTLDAVNDNTPS